MSGGAAIPMLDHPGTPSGSKFNKNLNASAQVIGPGTNEYHTKFLTLTWGGVDIRKALAAGKNYRIFLYCYFFENIQPITPFGKELPFWAAESSGPLLVFRNTSGRRNT